MQHSLLDTPADNDEAGQGPAFDQAKGLTWPRTEYDEMPSAYHEGAWIHEKAPSGITGRLSGGGDWI